MEKKAWGQLNKNATIYREQNLGAKSHKNGSCTATDHPFLKSFRLDEQDRAGDVRTNS